MTIRRWLERACFAVAVTAALPAQASAQAPAVMPIQGHLSQPDGTPIRGETEMTVRLYEDETGGASLFEETQTVTVDAGTFTFFLGDSASLDLSLFQDGRPLFVGITVEDDAEMTPRLPLGSVPYAALAQTAENAGALGGMTASEFAPASHEHPWSEVTGVPADLADGDDDTTYDAGDGLSLSGTTFSVDPSTVQSRVSGSCAAGSSIRAIAADGTVTCEPDDDTVYTDADAVSALASADVYVRNDGDTVTGNLAVTGTVSAGSSPTGVRLMKMAVSRECGSGVINYTAPDGSTHSIDTSDGTVNTTGTHIAYRQNGTGDGALYFNIDASPTIACTLLHNEDDAARPGYYFATDGGNGVSSIWGDSTTGTFILRREGATGLPIASCSAFAIMCF